MCAKQAYLFEYSSQIFLSLTNMPLTSCFILPPPKLVFLSDRAEDDVTSLSEQLQERVRPTTLTSLGRVKPGSTSDKRQTVQIKSGV